ncbi:Thiamin pyrophosphokinase, vitamin B1 binding domain [Acetatifactor muris]|uniref:Thiamine diphosphokinase n=1 Tax=Acetatifactor muris TaxID=879566 RepID=A0A2K4ZIR6_9FIRM|nr:thiamine diphosphokinase [Acetatifactor muris]SOY30350.1 Thiamin pyrophosphokinase, vitamin B1 binding domain [Acetatifactor muris]
MLAAIREGINVGYSDFYLYCGTGGRIDHTIANLQALSFLSENGKQGFLVDNESIITAITNRKITFDSIQSGYVSVFSYSSKAEGVCLQGLKYELDKAVLTNTFPIGVSNEFIGKESSISVDNGILLIVFPRK